jgi:hypothetical protein
VRAAGVSFDKSWGDGGPERAVKGLEVSHAEG